MRLNKQIVMHIMKDANGFDMTRELVENSRESFPLKPIMYNQQGKFKEYDRNMKDKMLSEHYLNNTQIIGCICSDSITIEDNTVYADIFIFESQLSKWNGKYDNWQIQLSDDNKSFELCAIEVF